MNIVSPIVLVIGAIVLIAIVALGIRRWIELNQHRDLKEKIPLFNCSITNEGKEPGNLNSPDVYDCIEAAEDPKSSDAKTKK